jgi:hypothetical protein
MSHSDPKNIEKRANNFGDPGHDPQYYQTTHGYNTLLTAPDGVEAQIFFGCDLQPGLFSKAR